MNKNNNNDELWESYGRIKKGGKGDNFIDRKSLQVLLM
jgi:hypothetical protein